MNCFYSLNTNLEMLSKRLTLLEENFKNSKKNCLFISKLSFLGGFLHFFITWKIFLKMVIILLSVYKKGFIWHPWTKHLGQKTFWLQKGVQKTKWGLTDLETLTFMARASENFSLYGDPYLEALFVCWIFAIFDTSPPIVCRYGY